MYLLLLEFFYVFNGVDDATAEPEERRPLPQPSPTLEGPRAETPAPRKLLLIEMTYFHRTVSKDLEPTRNG
jgi:hypothetical protein